VAFVVRDGDDSVLGEPSEALLYQMLGVRGSGAIPFPGADSIFSSLCGAICEQIRSAASAAIAAGFAGPIRGTGRIEKALAPLSDLRRSG
jgi:hypothetical protein